MKLNFCTLFDTNYLTRGWVMYQSLQACCKDFHLYVITFDDECYRFLLGKNLPNLTAVPLKEFEDPDLLKIKSARSAAEYCWTSTPSTVLYCIEKFKLENCTYIDADLCFYSNPEILWKEMEGKSILITEHRYTEGLDKSETSGKYCVQFVGFRNDEQGMKALRWWRNACLDWCYDRAEDGKFGDQKYLDDWPSRFRGVQVLQYQGGGLAPWNIQQYMVKRQGNTILVTEKTSGRKFEAVFFHFHGVKFYEREIVLLASPLYALSDPVKRVFYKPYIAAMWKAGKAIDPQQGLAIHGIRGDSPGKPWPWGTDFAYFLSDIKKLFQGKTYSFFHNRRQFHHYHFVKEFVY